MLNRPITQELIRTQYGERRDRVNERREAAFGQARRQPEHVLFRDANVEEAVGEALRERLDGGVAKVASEEDDARIVFGHLDQRLDEGGSHEAGSTSSIACRYCSSDMGQ